MRPHHSNGEKGFCYIEIQFLKGFVMVLYTSIYVKLTFQHINYKNTCKALDPNSYLRVSPKIRYMVEKTYFLLLVCFMAKRAFCVFAFCSHSSLPLLFHFPSCFLLSVIKVCMWPYKILSLQSSWFQLLYPGTLVL